MTATPTTIITPSQPVTRLVAIVGAESTGKTTLAQQLAKDLNGLWVPEYLRHFCEYAHRTPHQEEQAHILQTQAQQEDEAYLAASAQGKPWVFCDAAPITTAVYSELVFNDLSLYPRAAQLHQRFAFTLILANDVAWEADGIMRDGPHVRERVWALLQKHLNPFPHQTIEGQGEERGHAARTALHALMK